MSSSRKTRLTHTLAFRLTLWYGGIFTISSCVAFLLFYMLINSVIRDAADQDLLEKTGKFSALLASDGMQAVKRVAMIESQAAGERKIFFRLLSGRGDIFSSTNMAYWRDIGIRDDAIKELIQGKRYVFDTMVIPDRKDRVRILYALVGPGVILQLGQSMEHRTRFIEAFKKIFVATMAFLVILAAIIGWFMARKALSGLGNVTQTARLISGSALEERVPISGRGDEVDQLAVTFNQMLDRIQALVMEIKEMSDNIAHDLKSPITRIRGLAEITLTTETSLDDYRGMAGSTIEECDRLLDMINTMLFISKTEAGVGDFEPKEMDLSQVVRDACALFQPLAEERDVRVTWDVPDTCNFQGDIRMIQRMISNLLDNAIKYSPPGGMVEVTLSAEAAQSLVLSVHDTGTGISPDDLPHLFERFFRGDPSRTQTGAGLGLSLAQAVARAHGGNIEVSSQPDRGSTFQVSLPLSPSSPS
jgi:heavy metal sensor kinase